MKRKSPCKDPTHVRRKGTQRCVTCTSARQRARVAEKRAARGETLLLRHGETPHMVGARAMWERRRQKYGSTGRRPGPLKVGGAKRWPRKTHCARGHRLEGPNVSVHRYPLPGGAWTTRRVCLRCRRLKASGTDRPIWATTAEGVRVQVAIHDAWCVAEGQRLWSAMLAAHPDRGGSHTAFKEARRRWERFLKQEQAWYLEAGLQLPAGMKGKGQT